MGHKRYYLQKALTPHTPAPLPPSTWLRMGEGRLDNDLGGASAVNRNGRAGNERTRVAGEKNGERTNFPRLSPTPQRHHGEKLLIDFWVLTRVFVNVGGNGSGQNRIGGHVKGTPFERQCASHLHECGFAAG